MILLVFIIMVFIGGLLVKKVCRSFFIFKITNFNVAILFMGISYYLYPMFFEYFESLLMINKSWESQMVYWMFQDAIITAMVYASIVIIYMDLILKKIPTMPSNYQYLITAVKSLIIFFIVFFNEFSEYPSFHLSPTFWFLNNY